MWKDAKPFNTEKIHGANRDATYFIAHIIICNLKSKYYNKRNLKIVSVLAQMLLFFVMKY